MSISKVSYVLPKYINKVLSPCSGSVRDISSISVNENADTGPDSSTQRIRNNLNFIHKVKDSAKNTVIGRVIHSLYKKLCIQMLLWEISGYQSTIPSLLRKNNSSGRDVAFVTSASEINLLFAFESMQFKVSQFRERAQRIDANALVLKNKVDALEKQVLALRGEGRQSNTTEEIDSKPKDRELLDALIQKFFDKSDVDWSSAVPFSNIHSENDKIFSRMEVNKKYFAQKAQEKVVLPIINDDVISGIKEKLPPIKEKLPPILESSKETISEEVCSLVPVNFDTLNRSGLYDLESTTSMTNGEIYKFIATFLILILLIYTGNI